MTVDDLLALPENAAWQYELVDGRLVRMPASGWEASEIAARLIFALGTFVYPRHLGALSPALMVPNLHQALPPHWMGPRRGIRARQSYPAARLG